MSVGESTIEGRDAVISACGSAATELADATTEFTRLVSVVDTYAVAIDAIGRYVEADGQISVASSCDIYKFDNGALTTITSYAVELTRLRFPQGSTCNAIMMSLFEFAGGRAALKC